MRSGDEHFGISLTARPRLSAYPTCQPQDQLCLSRPWPWTLSETAQWKQICSLSLPHHPRRSDRARSDMAMSGWRRSAARATSRPASVCLWLALIAATLALAQVLIYLVRLLRTLLTFPSRLPCVVVFSDLIVPMNIITLALVSGSVCRGSGYAWSR